MIQLVLVQDYLLPTLAVGPPTITWLYNSRNSPSLTQPPDLVLEPLQLPSLLPTVIVMTFWYVLLERTYFFRTFQTLILGLITTPHVFYVHMTYVYFLFSCFFLHTITWPREVIIVL